MTERDRLKVGLPHDRRTVPTNQILQPAGKQVTFPGRAVDLLLIEDGKTVVAKNLLNLVFIDAAMLLDCPATNAGTNPSASGGCARRSD